MQDAELSQGSSFSTALPITVYIRPRVNPAVDWQEFDRGPGYFNIPAGHEVGVRIHNIDDSLLKDLVNDLKDCPAMVYLNLSENRKVSNSGLQYLKLLPQLTFLNLSSCDLTNDGIAHLVDLKRLESLNLSYCNRLTDPALKYIKSLPRLTYLDVQGCVKMTNGGLARIGQAKLTIHK